LKVTGATAFFGWPSRGSVTAYPADEANIEASEQAITDFLVDFTANCGAEKVHVIAHSNFAQAQALLHDIYDLMRLDAAPGKRQRITPAVDGGVSFWKLRE
jgi:Alpha/beta hydrolase of unknown function (DUF900)